MEEAAMTEETAVRDPEKSHREGVEVGSDCYETGGNWDCPFWENVTYFRLDRRKRERPSNNEMCDRGSHRETDLVYTARCPRRLPDLPLGLNDLTCRCGSRGAEGMTITAAPCFCSRGISADT
jgi:hypothetical protein